MKQRATSSSQPSAKSSASSAKKTRHAAQQHWLQNVRLQAIILAVLAVLLYAQTLSYDYALDDRIFITEHKAVQSGLAGIPELLTKHNMYSSSLNINQGRYRPLTFITFALEQQLAPNKPVLGHCVNVALYGVTAALLLVVLRRMLREFHPAVPFVAALLFVVHPIHTEVVANIKSRDLLLSLLFGLLALQALLRYHLDGENIKSLALGALWTALALLSQEGAVTFLAVFPLVVYFFTPASFRANLLSCAPLIAAGAAVLAVRAVVVGKTDDSWMNLAVNYLYVNASTLDALATKTSIMGRYLVQLVFPFVMSHDYGFRQLEVITWADWKPILALVAHVALIGWAVWRTVIVREKHILASCVFMYCATMAVTSNYFLYYGMPMSDRLLYAPSVAGMVAFAWLLLEAFKLNHSPFRLSLPSTVIACVAVVGVLYAGRTIARNPAWEDDFTLNKAGAEDTPRCIGTKAEYGRLCMLKAQATQNPLERQQLAQTAYAQLHEAIALDSTALPAAHSALGQYFRFLDKRYDSSVYYSARAARLDTGFAVFAYNEINIRADSAIDAKQYDRAIELIQQLKRFPTIQPEVQPAKMGVVLLVQQRFDEAIPYFQKALAINPSYAAAQQGLAYAQQMRAKQSTQ